MALRISSGLNEARKVFKARVKHQVIGNTISFGDGDGTDSTDTIKDSGNGLGDFLVGDMISVRDSTSNDGDYEILSVAAGTIEVAAGSLTAESVGAIIVLTTAKGGSLAELMNHGVIRVYSGSQPASADDIETGTLLVTITAGGGAFTPGSPGNGLRMGNYTAGSLKRAVGTTWSGTAVASGTAGWFRFYDNALDDGADAAAVRFDGNISTSGAQLNMSNTAITSGGSITIDAVSIV